MCTGITLIAQDGSAVYGRTMEWGSFDLESRLAIVPPGTPFQGSIPDRERTGMSWTTNLGFVGLDVLEKDMFADGMNQAGLACGMFYHAGYASYEDYDSSNAATSLCATDLVQYILGQCSSLAQVRTALEKVHVVPVPEPALGNPPPPAPVHFMMVEPSGAALVVEFLDHKMHLIDAPLRVITNAPEYAWHMTNLRNYVNLSPVALPTGELGGLNFSPLGAGSGMIGLPGDFTPPSRLVRAVAFTQTARPTKDAEETLYEHFRIMDNFNAPLGEGQGYRGSGDRTSPPKMPQALLRSFTQWTTAADTRGRVYYYHTQDNRRVRKVSINDIDFSELKGIQRFPLDTPKAQDIEDLTPRKK